MLLGIHAPCGLLLDVLKAGSRRFTPFVAMLQSSHSGQSYHPCSGGRLGSDHPKLRRILLQTQVTPVFVVILGSGVKTSGEYVKCLKKRALSQTALQRSLKCGERRERVLRIGCLFRLDRHARHPSGDEHLSDRFAALVQIPGLSKQGTPIGNARFLWESLSFGEKLRFEHNLTKSDVTLTTHKTVQMPVNTR
jgi:hypothetical protein